MILKTKDLKDASKKILAAIDSDKNINCLELAAEKGNLYLNITNSEFYVSVKFPLNSEENFRVVVNAVTFLSLIANISADEIEANIESNTLVLSSGTDFRYILPMIYNDDKLVELPKIEIANKTVEMPIKLDILQSILNVNSKELLKTKNINVNELQKLYFIDENGCFTFTTGACLNHFKLDKPIKILLNDRIVKLFKLFDSDIDFAFGHDEVNGDLISKVSFSNANIYVGAIITNDDNLIDRVSRPCEATKRYIAEDYDYSFVLSVPALEAALGRLMIVSNKDNKLFLPIKASSKNNTLVLQDEQNNTETIKVENPIDKPEYDFCFNMRDLQLVLDSCDMDTITFKCGNHRSIVIIRGPIDNLIPESKQA